MSGKISVGEDLMREHGLMNRLTLLYKEGARSAGSNDEALSVLRSTAKIMLEFIHEFHEENEENDVYPLFDGDKKLHRITEIMEEQHEVGKHITEQILSFAKAGNSPSGEAISAITQMIQQFEQMYIPHASLEDSVLAPALQEMIGDVNFMKMGAALEKKEDEKFGEEYFDKLSERIERLEKKLKVDDLSRFTARLPKSSEQSRAA